MRNSIANSFNYAIFANKMLLSAYIVKQHIDLMYLNKEQWIIGLLHIFNEYSEFNGSSTYHKGISHFEEILFHIEMMIKNFTYLLGEYFIESLENLLEVYNPNLYPIHYFPDKKQIIVNHFLVWCKNPVKIWVLIVYILKKLHQIFPDLKIQDITQKYLELANKIIENWEGTKEVEDMFTDYWLNGYEVIDLICYENIEELLSNHSVGLIIADFWTGPFYQRTFLGQSTWYQILASNVFKPYSFYEYLPNKYEEIAKWIRGLHVTKEKFFFFQMRKSDQHSHFFKLEAWK